MRKSIFLAATLVAALTSSSALATRHASPTAGIVVGSQHGVLLVTSSSGVVRALAGHAAIGDRVAISGTRIRVTGRVHRAVVRGVVLHHRGNLTFLSAAHHVLVVRAARSVASARDTAPAPGTVVQETVGIGDNGDLDQESEHQVGQSSDATVQAVVTAVGTGTVTITVNGQALTIPLPAGLTLPASVVGTQVTLNLSFANGVASATQAHHGDQGDDNEDDGDDDSGEHGHVGATGATSLSIAPPGSTSHK